MCVLSALVSVNILYYARHFRVEELRRVLFLLWKYVQRWDVLENDSPLLHKTVLQQTPRGFKMERQLQLSFQPARIIYSSNITVDLLLGLVALISVLFSTFLLKDIPYFLSLFSLSKQYIDGTVHEQDTSKILTECMHAWFCMHILVCVYIYACMSAHIQKEADRECTLWET